MGFDREYASSVLEQYRDEEEPVYQKEFRERYKAFFGKDWPASFEVKDFSDPKAQLRSDIVVTFGGEDDVFEVRKGSESLDEEEYGRYLKPR